MRENSPSLFFMFTLVTLLVGGAVTEFGRHLFHTKILPTFKAATQEPKTTIRIEEVKPSEPQSSEPKPTWRRSSLGGYTAVLVD